MEDGGIYTCLVINGYGQVSIDMQLNVFAQGSEKLFKPLFTPQTNLLEHFSMRENCFMSRGCFATLKRLKCS